MKQAEDGQFEYLTASRHRSPLVDEHLAYWLVGSPDRFARFTRPLNISRRYIESMRRNDTRRLSPAQILSSAPFIGESGRQNARTLFGCVSGCGRSGRWSTTPCNEGRCWRTSVGGWRLPAIFVTPTLTSCGRPSTMASPQTGPVPFVEAPS